MTNDLVANFALLTAFLFAYNLLFGQKVAGLRPSLRTKTIAGAVYGIFAILLMYFSVSVGPKTILDFRQLMIISSAAFGGLYASMLTGLITVIGRVLLFGGLNHSSIVASISALTLALGSGLISRAVRGHTGRMWFYSLLLSLICLTGTLTYLLGRDSLTILPRMAPLIVLGGIFVAGLTAYFASANRLTQELRASEERYRQLHSMQEAILRSASGVSIVAADLNGRITLFNRGAELMFGYRAKEMIGRGVKGFDVLTERAKRGLADEREWTFVRKDRTRLRINLIVTPVKDEIGVYIGYMGVATDITERKRAEEALRKANEMLRQLSLLDGLTEIPNRRHFDQALDREWSRAATEDRPLALVLFDIDAFKSYNDTYGHQAGDRALIQVAAAAKACLRTDEDIVARYGGEEFAVILPGANLSEATRLAEKMRAAVEAARIPHAGAPTNGVTVSAGVAAVRGSALPGAHALVAGADRALYAAKQGGRNQVRQAKAVREAMR
ncbi:diguanylate cyclase [Cohnella nanjingensis]|uniref:Diguanylate cyclase n=1 Tax=Cohnella nanjingensis TaxID=1387779 RepID=A0A7X0S0E0_9BACL|nr:diguanylate cyclase [Cohnella nanjingensis]MBB6675364.1 diguanylate cyclase [Cohnella nanjingensis]